MTKKQDTDMCQHPGCSCPRAEGSKYCSAYCEAAKDTAELTCECGHPDCESSPIKMSGSEVA